MLTRILERRRGEVCLEGERPLPRQGLRVKGDRHATICGGPQHFRRLLDLLSDPQNSPDGGHSLPLLTRGTQFPRGRAQLKLGAAGGHPPPTAPDCLSSQVSTLTVCEQITHRCGEEAALLSCQARLCTWMWSVSSSVVVGPRGVGSTGGCDMSPRPDPPAGATRGPSVPPQEADISGMPSWI